MDKKILLIEDDKNLALCIAHELSLGGYSVKIASTAKDALAEFEDSGFELILLDVNLPDGTGFDLCREIKSQRKIPIIFLTARDMFEDEVRGFDLGADDYITKPFKMELLTRRIEAVLRRYGDGAKRLYDDGFLRINFDALEAGRAGDTIQFTPTEYKLLEVFIKNPGKVLTRNILLSDIWDVDENFVDEHALTVNINRLRKKIEADGHSYVKTVYGMGYMWMGESL